MNKRFILILWIFGNNLELFANGEINQLNENVVMRFAHSNLTIRDTIMVYPDDPKYTYHPLNYKIWSAPTPSKGLPFPNVKKDLSEKFYVVFSESIKFETVDYECDIINEAVSRYYSRIVKQKLVTFAQFKDFSEYGTICLNKELCLITSVVINILNCHSGEIPSARMNEKYSIHIVMKSIYLNADESWGVLRGLETLAQLAIYIEDKDMIIIRKIHIYDEPLQHYRSLMIDTGRHFIPTEKLFENLDAMEMNKMNVFHWHLTDDQSFPFKGLSHPELAINGAFNAEAIYNNVTIMAIVEYARLRGIRVIPELDIPGHVLSWMKSYPSLATECFSGKARYSSNLGSMNLILQENLNLLVELYSDLFELFPDNYIHIGFNEIEDECMLNDSIIQIFMEKNDLYSIKAIIENVIIKLQTLIKQKMPRKKMIFWQDAFDQYKNILHHDSIIQFNKNVSKNLKDILNSKFSIIFSEGFYLNKLFTGLNWYLFYKSEFIKYYNTPVIGAEACMWTEFQSEETITSTIWPTTSGLAEALWSGQKENFTEIGPRLEELRCRMLRRGIPVGVASGGGSCKLMKPYIANTSTHIFKIPIYHGYHSSATLNFLIIFYMGLAVATLIHKFRK